MVQECRREMKMEEFVPEYDRIPEVPKRIGRPVRPMEKPYERGSAGHAPKCGECPQWALGTQVCSLRGCHQAGRSPACRYGIVLIRAKRMADRRAVASAGRGK